MTKRMLEEELVRASAFGDPCDLSVKQLCEGAGVSRVTFYKYYSSVDDLMDETARGAFEKVAGKETYENSAELEETVRYVLLNRPLYLMLIEKGYYERFMNEYLERKLGEADLDAGEKQMAQAETRYAAGGMACLLHYCLESQPDIPPKKLTELILRFYKSWHSDVLEMRNSAKMTR